MKLITWLVGIVLAGFMTGFGVRWLFMQSSNPPIETTGAAIVTHDDHPSSSLDPSAASAGSIPPGTVYQASHQVMDGFQEIAWEDLMPEDWDPMTPLKHLALQNLDENDPRAIAALKEAQVFWDNAPVNLALNGVAIRIPGFVLTHIDNHPSMKAFLLVPYFGASIYSPPPPANQIIHAHSHTALPNLKTMDTVWVQGILTAQRSDTVLGRAAYQLNVTTITPYAP
jgi:hypothetical protein